MSKLKQLKEERSRIFAAIDELRKAADGREMSAEEQSQWNDLRADYEKADRAVEREEQFLDTERRQAGETAERRDRGQGGDAGREEEYRSAYIEYLRVGKAGLSVDARDLIAQRKARVESRAGLVGMAGGVLVPETLVATIEKALKNYGGMFEAGTVISTDTGGDLVLPTVNDTASKAVIYDEYGQSAKKAPSFGSVTLKAYTYRTPIVPVSLELLQDAAFPLETVLGDLLSESFGRGANEHLTVGTGVGQPKGILTAATAADVKAAATALKVDDLFDLMRCVDAAYARDGKFMLNRNTLFAIAKLKDSNGRFIWQESLSAALPATLMNCGYVLNDDMPDIGAGKASMLFGDLKKYRIRMVRAFSVVRLEELLAEFLSVGLLGFARLDGTLLDAGTHPVKKLVHAAS